MRMSLGLAISSRLSNDFNNMLIHRLELWIPERCLIIFFFMLASDVFISANDVVVHEKKRLSLFYYLPPLCLTFIFLCYLMLRI